MTNRVTYAPQDVQKMCKQAERDHESRKLVVLMDRLKQQIAKQGGVSAPGASNNAVTAINADAGSRLPSRSVPLER